MEWINLHVPMFRAPEYIGSEPVARATWLNVLAYCVEQENGGCIRGAASWKDRQWQQTCGVTREEVEGARLLLQFVGEDVVVWRYPVDKEAAVREQREAGKRGGRPRKQPSENPRVNHTLNPQETIPQNGRGMEGEGNGKEVGTASGEPKQKRQALPANDEWLASLQLNPAYQHLNIFHEAGKARAWTQTKRRQFTRLFFLGWINRAAGTLPVTVPERVSTPGTRNNPFL